MRHVTVRMAMPETSVDEYDYTVLFKDYVRSAGKPLHIFHIPVTTRIQIPPHNHFGLGILAADTRHDGGTLLFVKNIHRKIQIISAGTAPVTFIKSEGASFI